MPTPNRLIVGLGNPGREYAGTRHNVGFEVVDRLAERLGVRMEPDSSQALVAEARWRGRTLALAKPQLFMNVSGTPVRTLARRYNLDPDAILVVVDDLHLDVGVLRVRAKGSAGGHNGTQSIIDKLGSSAFPRLRLGIGSGYRRGQQSDYVLSAFKPGEQDAVEAMLEQATDAALTFITDGAQTTMNRFNGKSG
jgi:PTH1 family peptidyl-tRNA hydrolase